MGFCDCFFDLVYFQVHPHFSTYKLLLPGNILLYEYTTFFIRPSIDEHELLLSSAVISADVDIGAQHLLESVLSVLLSVCL